MKNERYFNPLIKTLPMNTNIICFSDITWNFLWQRHQQILTRFPHDCNILFVEPSFWLSLAWSVINLSPLDIIPHKVCKNITIISVPTIPFGDKVSILRKINDKLINFWMKIFMKIYHLDDPVLMFYKPRYSCVLGKLDEKMTCYDITDDILEFNASANWLKNNVSKLINDVDLVVTASQRLYEKISQERNENIALIGNGVEANHFKKALGNIEKPKDLENIKSPILGYIGAVGEWFDDSLLEKILKERQDLAVVIIGWSFKLQKKKLKDLQKKYNNLYLLGRRSYQILPNYVKYFDVCLIPFKICQLTASVNPTKLYEYMAAGKPIVSTHMPELNRFKDIVYIANNHDEFLSYLDMALRKKYEIEKSIKIAEENDWNNKASIMINLINRS